MNNDRFVDSNKLSSQGIKVNAFKKKTIGTKHKTIYEQAANLIKGSIIYTDSALGEDWEDVILQIANTDSYMSCGKDYDVFHDHIIYALSNKVTQ